MATSLRDSAIWETEKGCKVRWTAMGEGGCVDQKKCLLNVSGQLCPGVAVNVERSAASAIEFPYLEADFWTAFPNKSGAEFARFWSWPSAESPSLPMAE